MILDSDVLIEILRGNPRTTAWLAARGERAEPLRYSPVTRAEIGAGARPGERDVVAALFAGLQAIAIDETTGELAGERLQRYRRSHGLELGDALIGAQALQHGESLATFNRRHYPGLTRLIAPDR